MQGALSTLTPTRLVQALVGLLTISAVLLVGSPALAQQATGKAAVSVAFKASGHHRLHRRHPRRNRRGVGRARISGQAAVATRSSAANDTPILDAGFENGLANWNTAGVGEVVPSVVSGDARSGTHAGRVVLTGSQSRSELGLGGNGTADPNGVDFYDGNEYWYGFSFNIQHMVYGHPGAHNVIMQFKSEGEGSPNFALQLWDYEGDNGEYADHPRGLWVYSQGAGDRYVAPAPEHAWHDVAIHFRASEHSNGFYELFVDGELVDQRSGISMIVPGKGSAYIKNGLYRNGSTIPGTSELLVDSAMLGHSASSVQPG